MNLWLVAALLSSTAPSDVLLQAQAAFEHHDYATAESLATVAAQSPHRGAALYLAGLARFREGHPEEALQALDEAEHADDPPSQAPWHYNRAACLYELGRFLDAEAEYLRAAELDPSLAVVSLVNAGFAAFDAGAPDRATVLAQRARAAANADSLTVVEDLEQTLAARPVSPEYEQGLADYGTRRYEAAEKHFRRAIEANAADGRSLIMLGATALKLGDRAEARARLEEALPLSLDSTDAQTARDYLASMSNGLAARGRGLTLSARVGIGYDSNYLQAGLVEFGPSTTTSSGSGFATASASAAWRARPSQILFTELSYGFDQLAYFDSAAADYSIQQHALTALFEVSPRSWLRFGASGTGQLDFIGLSDFRILQASGGAAAWIAADEIDRTTTRLGVEWTRKVAPLTEFDYLTGNRTDADFTQSLRLGPTTTELQYRYRSEAIGSVLEPVPANPPPMCGPGCDPRFVIPFAYSSHTVGLAFRSTIAVRWQVGASAGVEWRTYSPATGVLMNTRDGEIETNQLTRVDTRFLGDVFAGVRLVKGLDLSLRYDVVVNDSNIAGPPSNESYTKHVVLLETGYTW